MRGFLAGIVATLVVLVLLAVAGVWFGWMKAGADAPLLPGEKWAANRSLHAEMRREMPQPPYPYGPVTDATLVAGAKLYMTNCAVCHGSAGSDQSNISKGFYIHAPQFTKHGVDDDPTGETYWKIEHGIRFSAMPSFANTLTEEQIWQIAYFLKNGMSNLPPDVDAIWHQSHGD